LAVEIVDGLRGETKAVKGPWTAEFAHKGFSWASQVDKMIAIYEEVLTED
jgi:hypothetical protein